MAAPRNLKLDPTTGDLYFEGGKFALVYDDEAIKQSLRSRLLFFEGEWYLDETLPAVLSFNRVFVKNPNPVEIQIAIREVVIATPGVVEITSLELTLDTASRTLTIDLEVRADSGELIDLTVEI